MAGIIDTKSPFLRRVARVSGLLGVGIVFVANFLNDHAVAKLQDDVQNVDAVQSDAAQATEASNSGRDQLKAAERITELERQVAGLTSESPAVENQRLLESYTLYFTTLKSSVDQLASSLPDAIEMSTRGVTLDEMTTNQLDGVRKEVIDLQGLASSNGTELQSLKERYEKSGDAGEPLTDQINETLAQFSEVESKYKIITDQIPALFKTIEDQVNARQNASREGATLMEGFVYVLSALGAAIAGFGNWLSGRVGALAAAPEAQGPAGV